MASTRLSYMTYIPSNSQFARNSQFSEHIWTYTKLTGSRHFCYITPPPPGGEDNGFWVKQCLIGHPPFYKHQCHFTDVHNPSPDESNGPVLVSVRKPIAWCLTCFFPGTHVPTKILNYMPTLCSACIARGCVRTTTTTTESRKVAAVVQLIG